MTRAQWLKINYPHRVTCLKVRSLIGWIEAGDKAEWCRQNVSGRKKKEAPHSLEEALRENRNQSVFDGWEDVRTNARWATNDWYAPHSFYFKDANLAVAFKLRFG